MSKEGTKGPTKRAEVVIALIGLAGVTATGVLSNWDKLFSKTVSAQYAGYQPTGNFDTELRYYLEVTGMRKTIEAQQVAMAEMRKKTIWRHSRNAYGRPMPALMKT